jgi:hypothetical protein
MDARQRAKTLVGLNQRTLDVLSEFRGHLKKGKLWSAAHQEGFSAWKKHLTEAQEHARRVGSYRALPRAAWDLAIAQARSEHAYWTDLLSRARRFPGRKLGPEVFEDQGSR